MIPLVLVSLMLELQVCSTNMASDAFLKKNMISFHSDDIKPKYINCDFKIYNFNKPF